MVAPDTGVTLATADHKVELNIPAQAVPTAVVMKLRTVASAITLPPAGEGRRAVGDMIDLSVEREGQKERGQALEKPMEVRVAVTQDLLEGAAGDPANIVVQQRDTSTGRWKSLPTRIDEQTGDIFVETADTESLVATVPGPPRQAGEVLAIVNPVRESLLAPPSSEGKPPPPILEARPDTTDEIITLVYAPRELQQVPSANPGDALVGQPFELNAYRLDKHLPDYRFAEPLDVFIPFTQELLDVVNGDPTRFRLRFYDKKANPAKWADVRSEVIRDGIQGFLDHLSLLSLTAPAEIAKERLTVETPVVPRTASLFLGSLYDKSVPLTLGDVVSVELMVDSGGYPVGGIEATILYPSELLEVVETDTQDSVCSPPPAISGQETGRIVVRCSIPGAGYGGGSALVASMTMRARSAGLATVSFGPESRVSDVAETVDLLGYAPEMVLAIDRDVPASVYPEPIVPQTQSGGRAVAIIATMVVAWVLSVVLVAAVMLWVIQRWRARIVK